MFFSFSRKDAMDQFACYCASVVLGFWKTSSLSRFVPTLKRASLLACVLLLSGCATQFRAQVSSQHTWPPANLPATLQLPYRFASDSQQSNEERLGLEQQIDKFLSMQFWQLTDGQAASPAVLELAPSYHKTMQEKRVWEPYYIPMSVPIRTNNGATIWTTQMIYGGQRERLIRTYEMRLKIDLFSLTAGQRSAQPVWAGEASTVSGVDNANAVLPLLLEALFKDFPGPNGQNRQVTIELSR
ncbi:hypothetical protein [Parvibium lacunae]|uniref:DUF4136 domain-containing protein n=1 Tax=Parvibium lacunae TaxID=1888893 RepID=A0A368L3I9_9BURK|nr:hypothetical protein [Parvibium lacunae]RCS58147.1 hypothetical protein DU000_04755 [Parvibium lacunae]